MRARAMRTRRRPPFLLCVLSAVLAGGLYAKAEQLAAGQLATEQSTVRGPTGQRLSGQRLTVERVASLPSLIGTAPLGPAWSPDSTRLAFLWNDAGLPFRDVWLVEADGGAPRRLTDLRRQVPDEAASGPALAEPVQDSFVRLVREATARHDPGATQVIWSPDGRSLVFVYRGDLFRVGADGNRFEQLTRTAEDESAPAFSPDGKFLSYLSGGDLWLWNQKTGERVPVTRLGVSQVGVIPGGEFTRPDVEFSSYVWSPDGSAIALVLEDRRQVRTLLFPDYLGEETRVVPQRRDFPGDNDLVRAMAIYSLREGRLRPVPFPEATDRRIGSYSWSPDGSELLVDQTSEDAEQRWIYLVRRDDGSFRELWHSQRPKGGSTTSASQLWTSVWQSDGRGIVFISDVHGRHRLYALPVSGGEPRQLTDGDWSVVGAAFEGASLTASARTREVVFVSTRKSPYERQVYRMPETGGPVTQVSERAGVHIPFVSPNGSRVALLHSSDVTPTELYLVESRGGPERRVTRSPPDEFYRYSWIQPRYVTFKSQVDSVTLHGRLFEPAELDRTKKYPAVLGPVYSNTVRNQWRGTFGTFQQFLTLEGQYIVFQVDIRGSVGYGREFRENFVLNVGEIDIEDLESGVRYLKSLPYVDQERIGIWGWSYGGLLTAMSLFRKPGLYRAGVAGAPATNVWHATTGEVDLFMRPSSHPEAYRKGSAVTFAEGLRDPLMIIHGMQDGIVLFKDSVVLAEKLMMLGKDFDFVPLPSSVHDAIRRDYIAAHALKKIAEHFGRHLGGGPR